MSMRSPMLTYAAMPPSLLGSGCVSVSSCAVFWTSARCMPCMDYRSVVTSRSCLIVFPHLVPNCPEKIPSLSTQKLEKLGSGLAKSPVLALRASNRLCRCCLRAKMCLVREIRRHLNDDLTDNGRVLQTFDRVLEWHSFGHGTN